MPTQQRAAFLVKLMSFLFSSFPYSFVLPSPEHSWSGIGKSAGMHDSIQSRLTWGDFVRTRHSEHIPNNGLRLPEPVLENILCRLPDKELLKCNLVCRAWKDLLTRKSFWRRCFKHRSLNWEIVPCHIRSKSEGWVALYAELRHRVFSKNFIQNPSGRDGFDHWTIVLNGGNSWKVEAEPRGCQPLPESTFFGLEDKSCFVTSYEWCSKFQLVDLRASGLKLEVMKICLPFEIKCSQMFTTRFDCGGKFTWVLELLDSNQEVIQTKEDRFMLAEEIEWETTEYSFRFGVEDVDKLEQVCYLRFTHIGKDSKWWAGHYGMKFARSSITIQCLNEEEDPSINQ